MKFVNKLNNFQHESQNFIIYKEAKIIPKLIHFITMKKIILISLLLITSSIILGQTAYIEVKGEPDLSVFLNSKFKGKTTVGLGGLIIENVPSGKNLIKIVKEGFIPFEETITLKPDEVFSYKVKPFIKNKVTIEESGNSGETDKKATIETGKLIIQSVPINIKITIPSIEGVSNTVKAKDEWIVNNITAGTCEVTFTYNKKIIKKTFEIIGGETTNVFINMLNGDYKTKNTIEEKNKVTTFIDSLSNVYKFEPRMKKEDFIKFNPEAATFLNKKGNSGLVSGISSMYSNKQKSNAPIQIDFDENNELIAYGYSILITKKNTKEVTDYYDKLIEQIKKFSDKYVIENDVNVKVSDYSHIITFEKNKKQLFILFQINE